MIRELPDKSQAEAPDFHLLAAQFLFGESGEILHFYCANAVRQSKILCKPEPALPIMALKPLRTSYDEEIHFFA